MTTLQLVRICLEHHRACGLTFDEAWSRALRSIPRGGENLAVRRDRAEWVTVLQSTREHWEAAFAGLPAPTPVPIPVEEMAS